MRMNHTHPSSPPPSKGCVVVIFNPTKIVDHATLPLVLSDMAQRHGWARLVMLPTRTDDPGFSMTRMALRLGADLVLAVGGDGTVRVVSTGLAHTGVPCAIIPMGTGNLLARNLGIPLELADALELAFAGTAHPMDMIKVVVDRDEEHPTHFAGMAGVGFDAAMMQDTDERLKRVVGTAAYVVAFAKTLGTKPRKLRLRVDAEAPVRRTALLMLIGNTSTLQGGIRLFPDAEPDDGRLDLLLSAPTSLSKWARLVHAVVGGASGSKAVEYWSAARIVLSLEEPALWEVDGDTQGEGRRFEFTVEPGALLMIAPQGGFKPARSGWAWTH